MTNLDNLLPKPPGRKTFATLGAAIIGLFLCMLFGFAALSPSGAPAPADNTQVAVVQASPTDTETSTPTDLPTPLPASSGTPKAPPIRIQQSSTLTPPSSTPVPPSTDPALPSPTPIPPSPTPVCAPDATFVADVTVPDGTIFLTGAAISKVWRMRNSGACTWMPGTVLAFVGGARLSASDAVLVLLASPATTADIAVGMTAPDSPGTYTGVWRLRSPTGGLFGESVSVVIRVAAPTPTMPTATSTLIPVPTSVPPTPAATFGANPNPLELGSCTQLSWNITGGTSPSLYGGQFGSAPGVAIPQFGQQMACPTSTSNYYLRILYANVARDKSVVVTVRDTTPPPEPNPISPLGDFTYGGCSCNPQYKGMVLNWGSVSDKSGILRYKWLLESSSDGNPPWALLGQNSTDGTTLSANITSLVECQAYTTYYRWKIQAEDRAGNFSQFSPYVNFNLVCLIG